MNLEVVSHTLGDVDWYLLCLHHTTGLVFAATPLTEYGIYLVDEDNAGL
jgi:hypothetical protein